MTTDEYTQRCLQGWENRECTADRKLKPFSQAEVEHICLLNDHLKQLTIDVVMKAQRVSKLFHAESAKGNNDFEDYEVAANIGMTYNDEDDDYDNELNKLIDYTWKLPAFEPISLPSCTSDQEQADAIAKTLELYNNEQSGIGRLWNEMWDVYHISLSWAFGYFFNHLNVFTMADIMKIQPNNFYIEVKISL